MEQKPIISLIAALGKETRAIGHQGDLIWKSLKEDMARFKTLTTGHPVIMGRRTWESIPDKYRPLPNRTNIVLSGNSEFQAEGATVTDTIDKALEIASCSSGGEEVFVIGGGEIYNLFMPIADRLYLTLVDDDTDGDAHFPPYDEFTKVIDEEHHDGNPSYTFVTVER